MARVKPRSSNIRVYHRCYQFLRDNAPDILQEIIDEVENNSTDKTKPVDMRRVREYITEEEKAHTTDALYEFIQRRSRK